MDWGLETEELGGVGGRYKSSGSLEGNLGYGRGRGRVCDTHCVTVHLPSVVVVTDLSRHRLRTTLNNFYQRSGPRHRARILGL